MQSPRRQTRRSVTPHRLGVYVDAETLAAIKALQRRVGLGQTAAATRLAIQMGLAAAGPQQQET